MNKKTEFEATVHSQLCEILKRRTNDAAVTGLTEFVGQQLSLIRDALDTANCFDEPVRKAISTALGAASKATGEFCSSIDTLADAVTNDWDQVRVQIDVYMVEPEAAGKYACETLEELLNQTNDCAPKQSREQEDLAATGRAKRELEKAIAAIEDLMSVCTCLPERLRDYLENESVLAGLPSSNGDPEEEFAL